MYEKFLKNIIEHNLIEDNDRVVCGISGGRDSMVMLDLLLKLKEELNFQIIVAHFNHMVRGNEAFYDENFVKEFCEGRNIEFHYQRKNMDEYSIKYGLSKEDRGRRLRYGFFYSLNPDKIAVAHNSDDQVETVLMRIINGTGIKGLSGIQYRNGIVIRPILDFSRNEITQYTKINNIPYVDDKTNFENDYLRNKIRNDLIPKIEEEFNENFKESILRLSNIAEITYDSLERVIEDKFFQIGKNKKNQVELDIDKLLKENRGIQNELIRYSYNKVNGSIMGLEKVHVDEILNLLNSQSGKKFSIGDISIYNSFGKLYFIKDFKEIEDFSYELTLGDNYIKEIDKNFHVKEVSAYSKTDSNSIYLPFNKGDKLIVRNRRNGDKIKLNSLKGSKKIKEILREKKIPEFLRNQIAILLYNDTIVWIGGILKSDLINLDTKNKIYKITMED